MAKKKVTRKQLLKEPDEFITLSSKVIQWCRQYPKQLTYGIGAVIAVIVILVGVKTFNDHRSRAAAELLSKGLNQIRIAEKENTDQIGAMAEPLDQLITSYGGQPAGRLGRIIYAHVQLTNGDADKAIELYQNALKDFKQDPSLVNIIYNGLASAYEKKGMTGEAIEQFEKIAQAEGKVLKDRALFHLGRLYRLNNEMEKSQQAYSQLLSDFPESIYAPVAKELNIG